MSATESRLAILVTLSLAIAGCGNDVPAEATARAAPVRAARVERAPATEVLRAIGVLAPADEVRLAFTTSGVIRRIEVEQGAIVKKGQLLAALADDEVAADLMQARAVAEQARRDLDQCTVLGRAFDYATAREWSLKLKELAQVHAEPYSSADFQHGPLALVEPGYQVLAVAPSGLAGSDLAKLVSRLREEHEVDALVVSDDPLIRASGSASLELPSGLPEWLMPIVSIVPGQLFALYLTVARGLDPERPRWISKVTETR